MSRSSGLALIIASVCCLPAAAQPRPLPPAPAPLFYVRMGGAEGVTTSYYQGRTPGRGLDSTGTVGLRPGYVYRVKMTGFPHLPDVSVYPTLEVRGTLVLPQQVRGADHPAQINISEEEVEKSQSGGYMTKVVYLEHPDLAQPTATSFDHPLETDVRPTVNPLEEARNYGRPVLIVRLGGRGIEEEELIHTAIPGTVLLPGDKSLGRPAAPPYVPYGCMPAYDPIAGPKGVDDECFHDGGDLGRRAGFDRNGELSGLDPSDTIATYRDSRGIKHISPSNLICFCVPRFAVLRHQTMPIRYESSINVGGSDQFVGTSQTRARQPSLTAHQDIALAATKSRTRPSGMEVEIGPITVANVEGKAEIIGQMKGESVVGTVVKQRQAPPDGPLVLKKTADKQVVQIGDVITFHLAYTNTGGQPIDDVIVSDSLTGRLEYVRGSSKSDRGTTFTMQENEAGSLILRWEVGGTLPPGQSGEIMFQARVR